MSKIAMNAMHQVSFIKKTSVVCLYILPWSFRKVYTQTRLQWPSVTLKKRPNIWCKEPVVTEMPSDYTMLQFCWTAFLTPCISLKSRRPIWKHIQISAMTLSSTKENPVSQPWILITTSFQESIIQLSRTWTRNDQEKGKEGTVKSTKGNPQLERNLWWGRRTRKGKIAGEWEWGKVFLGKKKPKLTQEWPTWVEGLWIVDSSFPKWEARGQRTKSNWEPPTLLRWFKTLWARGT